MSLACTVGAVVDLYRAARPGVRSDAAWADCQKVLSAFCERFAGLALGDCSPFLLASWLSEQSQWRSDWTRSRIVRTIQRAFNWARKLGVIPANPFAGFSVSGGRRGQPMTEREFNSCIEGVRAPFARVLRFLRFTGCRPCEARALQWRNVDAERGLAVLLDHKTVRTRRDHAPRVIVLNHEASQVLVEILAAGQEESEEFVFLNQRGRPWTRNALALQMRRLRDKGKIPPGCRLYGLRHRFGTIAAESGLDLKAIAELLGHTSTAMAEHYIHVGGKPRYLRTMLAKVEGL